MSIYLKDANGTVYTFGESFFIEGLPWSMRVNGKEIAYSHGVKDIADNKIDKRLIVITGDIHGSDYETQLAALNAALFKQNQTLYYDADKYLKVKTVQSVSHKNVRGAFGTVCEVEIKLFCEDPFFYKFTQTSYFVILDSSPKQFTVTNPGKVDVFPVLGLTALVTISTFELVNITTGMSFIFHDTGFTPGKTITIDCVNGEVDNSGTDAIRYFDGLFPSLAAGGNIFQYTGATIGGLSFLFYERNL